MTGRLKLIEQQILGANSAEFQNLCDAYLHRRERNFISYNKTGSHFGKQKTIKGTPDTYFRLADGSLRFVEFTTTKKEILKKLKKDIDSCLDFQKTKIPVHDISKVILCFNIKLKVEEEKKIFKYGNEKKIALELIGLDTLALEIYDKHPIIAKDILGLSLDTGQLLSLPDFIDEYNHKGGNISTPLDNKFFFRETELEKIKNKLMVFDIVFVTGDAGVGKSKISIEAIQHFISANTNFIAFAVSNKSVDIFEDLRIQLEQDKDYILLIDDANRQLPNFQQILGVFKEKRKGQIKLVITVRKYAFRNVKKSVKNFLQPILQLKNFQMMN